MQHFADPKTYEVRFDEAENDIFSEVEKKRIIVSGIKKLRSGFYCIYFNIYVYNKNINIPLYLEVHFCRYSKELLNTYKENLAFNRYLYKVFTSGLIKENQWQGSCPM